MFFTALSRGDLRPSFFELYAQEHLVSCLEPGFSYLLEAGAIRSDRVRLLSRHSQETFALLLAAVEAHSLFRYGGTVAEVFYGLRRSERGTHENPFDVAYVRQTSELRISPSLVLRSLLAHVLIPYLKRKADAWYQDSDAGTQLEAAPGPQSPPGQETLLRRRKLLAWLRKVYPLLNLAHDSAHFAWNLLYLFDMSSYFSPFSALTQLVVRRMTSSELSAHASNTPTRRQNDVTRSLLSWGDRAMTAVKLSLVGGVFLFKLLEYYYSSNGVTSSVSRPIVPQPPQPLPRNPEASVGEPRASNCPICNKARQRPAVCTTSGYVFCFNCINRAVHDHGRCPVTRLPATTQQIRILYDAQQ